MLRRIRAGYEPTFFSLRGRPPCPPGAGPSPNEADASSFDASSFGDTRGSGSGGERERERAEPRVKNRLKRGSAVKLEIVGLLWEVELPHVFAF